MPSLPKKKQLKAKEDNRMKQKNNYDNCQNINRLESLPPGAEAQITNMECMGREIKPERPKSGVRRNKLQLLNIPNTLYLQHDEHQYIS